MKKNRVEKIITVILVIILIFATSKSFKAKQAITSKSIAKIAAADQKQQGLRILPPTEMFEKAASLKPKRLFKGPLPWNYARENLSPEDFKQYQKNNAREGRNFGSKVYEIMNLMDGQRNLLAIRHIISCEYNETEIEFVLHFVEDLKKMGLVEF